MDDLSPEALRRDGRLRLAWLVPGVVLGVLADAVCLMWSLGALSASHVAAESFYAARAPAGYVVLAAILPLTLCVGLAWLGYRVTRRARPG